MKIGYVLIKVIMVLVLIIAWVLGHTDSIIASGVVLAVMELEDLNEKKVTPCNPKKK